MPGLGHLVAASWYALLLALTLHVVKVATTSEAWRNIIAAAYPGAAPRRRDVFGAYLAGAGLGAFLPGRAGDLVRVHLVRGRVAGASYATLGGTLFVESLFDFVIGLGLLAAAVSLGLVPGLDLGRLDAAPWIAGHPPEAALAGLAAVCATAGLALRFNRQALSLGRRVGRGLAVLGDWRTYLRQVVLWQAVNWLLRFVALYWFLRAFGVAASPHNALAVQAAQNASALLPVTPSGIGTEQAAIVYVLGDPVDEAVGFSVGMKLSVLALNILLGLGAIALMLRTLGWRRVLRESREAAQET